MKNFSEQILSWYKINKRDLPWRFIKRKDIDPYKIWVSEIMLQQTTVKAVIPFYVKFIKKWPDVCSVAKSTKSEILLLWSGLGYYNRANNLYECAKIICKDYKGKFPSNEKTLIKLPGIGSYSAAAITALAFGKRALVIDTNIERIISRLILLSNPLQSNKNEIKQFLEKVTPFSECFDFPQALMDLGSLICKKDNPKCEICPLSNICLAYKSSLTHKIPHKYKKRKKVIRKGKVYLILNDKKLLFHQRPLGGLLPGMIFLPTSGWDGNFNENFPDLNLNNLIENGVIYHEFSHFKLEMSIYVKTFTQERLLTLNKDYFWYEIEKFSELSLSGLLKKILLKVKFAKII